MSVLNDRAQGGSSLTDGNIEIMVHRRMAQIKALDFKLDEPGVDGKGLRIRGKHYLYIKPIAESAQLVRPMAESLFMAPIVTFAKYNTMKEYSDQRVTTFSGLSHSLPENIHLLNLENWKQNQVLVRFEHFYESSDNNVLSKPVELNLENLFKTFKIIDSVETNLAANELSNETKRMHWKKKLNQSKELVRSRRESYLKFKLSPQQIRTFILTIEMNKHIEGIYIKNL